jgi:precorrin-2/cobalt-factor-2 C20-methyltransferase
MTLGILYGIGVGPGQPDLITLRAVRVLARVDVVFAARSTRNDYSLALSIAEPHLKPEARIERLGFPMSRDPEELTRAWEANGRLVAEVLRSGHDAAFLTLGDPMIYSTFGYLLQTLERMDPDLPVEVIPGVTSYQAAAARTRTILTESGENLLITSGVEDDTRFQELLPLADNAVILKTYKQFGKIRGILEKLDLARSTVLASRVGLPDERIIRDIGSLNGDTPPYLSLMIVKKSPKGPEDR